MEDIMKALRTFVMWLQEGMYDFSSFPLTLKDDVGIEQLQVLKKLHDEATTRGELYHN